MQGGVRHAELTITSRSRATHERITSSLLSLVDLGRLHPNANEVAQYAGVSLRTIYHHFHDLDYLYSAALAQQADFVRSRLVAIEPTREIIERCDLIAENRDAIHADLAPILRSYMADPVRAEQLKHHREHISLLEAMQGQTRATFVRDLRLLPDPTAGLLGMETALSFAVWEYLRRTQGVSRTGTRQYMSGLALSIVRSFGA
jgi:TetR/AcrR family transcriptional regulator of autoinduction and epiphytic fitness